MKPLSIETRNAVLRTMAKLVEQERNEIILTNQEDLAAYDGSDLAMEERLKVDDKKVDEMILSLNQLASQEDPVGVERFHLRMIMESKS